jgi:hypothetical protein
VAVLVLFISLRGAARYLGWANGDPMTFRVWPQAASVFAVVVMGPALVALLGLQASPVGRLTEVGTVLGPSIRHLLRPQ